jgi:hypothetical protein
MGDICELAPPEWLVQDWIPQHGTGLLYAPSGVGKSFVGADAAYAVLTGQSWHGKAVDRGSVVYVVTEGKEGFAKRLRAVRQRAGYPEEAPFRMVTRPVNLLDMREVESFVQYAQTVGTGEYPVRLIVIDTLNRCMPGVPDENSNAAMSQAVAGAEYIADNTGAFVLLVHHTGKNGSSPRGGYALECNTDARLRLGDANTKPLRPGGTVKLHNEKQRDDNLQEPITLSAEVETLPDGSTSLVLVSGGKVRTPRKSPTQKARIIALSDKKMPNREIAARLGIPVGTVSSILARRKSDAAIAADAAAKSRLHAVR